MTDIGTGSYTIIAQTAAEMMGVPLEKVVVHLGDSSFPVSARLRRAVRCEQFDLGRLCRLRQAARSGGAKDRLQLRRRRVCGWTGVLGQPKRPAGDRRHPTTSSWRRMRSKWRSRQDASAIDLRGAFRRARRRRGDSRDPRTSDACRRAAGRVLNPKTARSQVIGAMTMGVGAALMEELAVDKRTGFFVNHDLAGYEVPVHADIPAPGYDLAGRNGSDVFADEGQRRSVSSGYAASPQRWPMPSTTRPAYGYATTRSRSTSCCIACPTPDRGRRPRRLRAAGVAPCCMRWKRSTCCAVDARRAS